MGTMDTTTSTFYLVRHAHANWTPDEMRPLSAAGRAAALRVADALTDAPITRIVSSPYCRAWETVAPLAERLRLPITAEPDLRERALGTVSPSAFRDAVRATWDDFDLAHPGGETNREARRRGCAVVTRLRAACPGEHIVLGTHGNLLALILNGLLEPGAQGCPTGPIDFRFWSALSMPDIYLLQLAADRVPVCRRLYSEA